MKRILFVILSFSLSTSLFAYDCEPKNKKEERLLELGFQELTDEFMELIEGGVNPNVCDAHKSSLINIASFWNQTKMVSYLVSYSKADVNFADELGWSPLALAVFRGNFVIVNLLLKAPLLKFEQIIPQGHNLFHICANTNPGPNDIRIAEKLMVRATPILLNSKNARGFTPLHFAIKRNKIKLVNLLLETKMNDLNMKSPQGNSYVEFAREEKLEEIALAIELFIEATKH